MLLIFTLLIITSVSGNAQGSKVPPFKMQLSGGKIFSAADFPADKPMIIIYFSPDCEDCIMFIENLLQRMSEFRKASIAMVTYLPVDAVNRFIVKYNLNMYPNLYVGTEKDYMFLKDYFRIVRFPVIALYKKNGDLVKIWRQEHNPDEPALLLKTL